MDNSALLHSVGERASQAGSAAENALLGVADLVADAAIEVGNLVQEAVDSRRRPPRRKRGVGLLLLVVLVSGAMLFIWRRRSQSSALSDGEIPPYPTSDPAYDQKAIDEAAERMGSTGHGTYDPDPTNSHDPGALHEGARRMGAES
jgi:hypothetical protein